MSFAELMTVPGLGAERHLLVIRRA